MKTGSPKSRRVAATAAKKNRRHGSVLLDQAGNRGGKPKATAACSDRIENQAQAEDLAQLLFKYFGDEIREALIEVEGSLSNEKTMPQHNTSRPNAWKNERIAAPWQKFTLC
jgi:hypothetical protein